MNRVNDLLMGIYQYDNFEKGHVIVGKGVFSHNILLRNTIVGSTNMNKCIWIFSIKDITTNEDILIEEVFFIKTLFSLKEKLRNNKCLSCVAVDELISILHLLPEYKEEVI